MRCIALAAVAASLLSASPVQAEASPSTCELHIWPAPPLKTITQGVLWNDAVDHALNGPHPVAGLTAQSLPPADQLAALAAENPGAGLGIGSASIIDHEQPLGEQALATPIRHDPSQSGCYAELVVSRIVYASDPLAGRSLNILFQFRDFGSGAAPVRSFSTWSHRPLTVFPAKAEADSAAAAAEIRAAFGQAFGDFSLSLAKAEAKARKKT